MICYLDRTFCGSPNCQNQCGRQLTDEIKEGARKWWKSASNPTGAGAPIATSNFCDKDGNYNR